MGDIRKELTLPEQVRRGLLRLDLPLRFIAMANGDGAAIDRLPQVLGVDGKEAFRLRSENIARTTEMHLQSGYSTTLSA